ncbi:MAG: hypothetical protein RLZZ494_2503 [Pseudomonadota bacterium]|jgi:diguanylate cyclase (GGDEF)-like protein
MHPDPAYSDASSTDTASRVVVAEPDEHTVRSELLRQLVQRERKLSRSSALGTLLLIGALLASQPVWTLLVFATGRAVSMWHSMRLAQRLGERSPTADDERQQALGMSYAGLSWALALLFIEEPLGSHWTHALVLLVMVAVSGFMSSVALLSRRVLVMFMLALWLPVIARGLFIVADGKGWLLLAAISYVIAQCHFGFWQQRKAYEAMVLQLRNQALVTALELARADALQQSRAVAHTNAQLQAALSRVSHLASHDELTQQLNRRAFLARMTELEQNRATYGLCLVDLDHFKSINDQHGHQVGDEVLVLTAQTLQAHLRPDDVLARWGGEEFVICLAPRSVGDMQEVTQRLCQTLTQLGPPLLPQGVRVSGSFGLALWMPEAIELEEALIVADQALYQAKREGRNRVCSAPVAMAAATA